MKRLIILLFGAVLLGSTFASCDDDDNGRLNPSAPLYINGQNRTNKNLQYAVDAPLTPLEILRGGHVDVMGTAVEGNKFEIQAGEMTQVCPFDFRDVDHKIDTINCRLILVAANIDEIEDNLFISPTQFTDLWLGLQVRDENEQWLGWDTVAYIPNAQRNAAYEQIKALWDTENWDAIYEIFQNSYTFVPCTGAEYKALKEDGLN